MYNSISTNVLSGGFEWCTNCTPAMSVYHEAVLRFDPGTLQWTQVCSLTLSTYYLNTIYTISTHYLQVGHLGQPRAAHGFAVVRAEDIQDYCN